MKLVLRIETEIGPRSLVMSRMNEREARAIAAAFERFGQGAFVSEDGRIVNLAAKLKRRRAAKARKASREDGYNITPLPAVKSTILRLA